MAIGFRFAFKLSLKLMKFLIAFAVGSNERVQKPYLLPVNTCTIGRVIKRSNTRNIFLPTKTITTVAFDCRRFYYPVLVAPIRSLLTFPDRLPSLMDSICKTPFPQSLDKETNRSERTGANLIVYKLRNNRLSQRSGTVIFLDESHVHIALIQMFLNLLFSDLIF